MSEPVYQVGIQLILYLQGLGSWLTPLMVFFSYLGNELFFLLIMPIFYWSIDSALGLRLGLYLMTSLGINSAFKLLFHAPRPYWYTAQVKAYASEASFGIPSGHAQNAMILWVALAFNLKRAWLWVLSILIILIIGISRMYLGVHFPTDALAGWLIGFLLLLILTRLEKPIIAWAKVHNLLEKLAGALTLCLLLILFSVLARLSIGAWTIPDQWIENARIAFPNDPIDPFALSGVVSSAGAFFGLAAGAIFMQEKGGYSAGGDLWKRVVRYILGLIGLVIIYFGLSSIFPHDEAFPSQLLRFLRYGLVGFWLTYLAPLLFQRLSLASKQDRFFLI